MGKTKQLQTSQKLHLLNLHNDQKALPIPKRLISHIVQEILSFLKIDCKEISIYFTTKAKISELHDEFFNDPTPTDCISFPLDQDHLGEIFVCPEVAIEYAAQKHLNPFQETILYMVHGILHLIGYDDIKAPDRKLMRQMEKKCMNHIKSFL